MSESMTVEVLTPEQQAAVMAEINQMYGFESPTAETILKSPTLMPRDRNGKGIITLSMYEDLQSKGERVDTFMMQVVNPTNGQIKLCPANKLTKWRGNGYVTVEEWRGKQKVAAKQAIAADRDRSESAIDAATGEAIEVFRCSVKYPDCKRFFDSARSRQTHWGLEHEKKIKKSES